MRNLLVAAGIAASLSACSYHAEAVPVRGAQADIRALAGEWVGDYSSPDSRRIGSITFFISAKGDSGAGDVLMETAVPGERLQHIDTREDHVEHVRSTELLAIRFVAIAGGLIRGEMEAYLAPDCRCTVRTTFTGEVKDGVVRGTYVTVGVPSGDQRGTWVVRRVERRS